ncbi:MAG: hypothetical protein JNL98_00765 [Bryobacterales bacterium]|nr:hypothetical protein [Bryobacterales bacterium]
MAAKRPPGRPPSATGPSGEPEKTSQWPKIAVNLRPSTKVTLDGLCWLQSRSAWMVIEDALLAYAQNLPPDQRKKLATLIKLRDSSGSPQS